MSWNKETDMLDHVVKELLKPNFAYQDFVVAMDKTLTESQRLNQTIALAVMDKEAKLAFFYRQPEAILIASELAPKKAYSALALGMNTDRIGELTQAGGPLYHLETSTEGKIVSFAGGVLIKDSCHQIKGSVGVSGALNPADDAHLASYFIDQLLQSKK